MGGQGSSSLCLRMKPAYLSLTALCFSEVCSQRFCLTRMRSRADSKSAAQMVCGKAFAPIKVSFNMQRSISTDFMRAPKLS